MTAAVMTDERDMVLVATLAHVPALGWTTEALRAGLSDSGLPAGDAAVLFPGGAAELAAAFTALADRWMAADAAAADFSGLRTPGRVKAVIALRLARLRPYREAVRLAAGLFALPHMAVRGARAAAATVDAIWHAAGEPLDDASRHSKRPILAAVYAATVLVWLRGADDAATLAFLGRRLGDVARIGKLRGRLTRLRRG